MGHYITVSQEGIVKQEATHVHMHRQNRSYHSPRALEPEPCSGTLSKGHDKCSGEARIG